MGAGERDTYNGLPRAQSNERKGMSELVWPLHKQAPALETYVPLCASHSLATRSCASYPLGNYFSPISGLPLAVEIPVTPRTIKHPHIYGHRPGEEDCSSTSSPPCFYSSQGPLIFKAYDMDGQKLSLYHPGMSSETLFNRTARCWNGDVDEVGLWDPQQVGTSPRYECFGGPRNGQVCQKELCIKEKRGLYSLERGPLTRAHLHLRRARARASARGPVARKSRAGPRGRSECARMQRLAPMAMVPSRTLRPSAATLTQTAAARGNACFRRTGWESLFRRHISG